MEGLLSTKEYCEKENIARTTLWRWVAKGKVIQYKDPITGYSYYKDPDEKMLSIKDVCYRLKISDRTLRNYVKAGIIKPDKYFTKKFSEKEVERFEKSRIEGLQLVEPLTMKRRNK